MKLTLRVMTLRASTAALCITVASCALLFPPRVKIEKAVLDQMPIELPHRESRGATLLVFPPETTPIYDTIQMAYRARPHEVAYFSQREWGETPSQMLHPLLVKTVENTRAFSAVLIPPYRGRCTYALRTEILELTQDFTSESATLVLSLRFQLTDYAANPSDRHEGNFAARAHAAEDVLRGSRGGQ